MGFIVFWAVVAFIGLVWCLPLTPVRAFFAAIAIMVWSLATLVIGGVLGFQYTNTGPHDTWNCPEIPGSSNYFPSHWSWVPPGPVCEFPSGDVGPSYWNIPLTLLFIVIPTVLVTVLLWRGLMRISRDDERVRSDANAGS